MMGMLDDSDAQTVLVKQRDKLLQKGGFTGTAISGNGQQGKGERLMAVVRVSTGQDPAAY